MQRSILVFVAVSRAYWAFRRRGGAGGAAGCGRRPTGRARRTAAGCHRVRTRCHRTAADGSRWRVKMARRALQQHNLGPRKRSRSCWRWGQKERPTVARRWAWRRRGTEWGRCTAVAGLGGCETVFVGGGRCLRQPTRVKCVLAMAARYPGRRALCSRAPVVLISLYPQAERGGRAGVEESALGARRVCLTRSGSGRWRCLLADHRGVHRNINTPCCRRVVLATEL